MIGKGKKLHISTQAGQTIKYSVYSLSAYFHSQQNIDEIPMYGHKCKKTNTNSKNNKRVWLLSISQRKCVEGGRVHKLNALSLPSRHDLFVKRETMLIWTSCTLMQLLSRTPSVQHLSSCKQWAHLLALWYRR